MPARIVSTVPSSLPRKIRVLAGSIAACLGSLFVAPQQAEAQLQWDSDGDGSNATLGGDGIWNSTNPFWYNGSTDVVWPNVSPSTTIAVFGGTAGEVTLGEALFANGLTFNTTGYTITGAGNTLTLNGTAPTVTVSGSATDKATIDAIIGGAGFTKAGVGILSLEGTDSNIFTGTLTASAGTLDLAKAGGAIAVSGNLSVGGAAVRYIGVDQIADTSSVTMSSGSIALNGFSDTISSLTLTGGTFTGSGGTLTLNSTTTALSLRNVNMTGNVVLAGATGGSIAFDSTNNGTGTISGNVDLGNVARVITVANGTAVTDLNISGVISGSAGFNKDGDGTLQLSGASANNYTGTMFLNRGNLQLNKSSGNAISGNLDVTPTGGGGGNPLIELLSSDQIEDTGTLTLRGFSGIGGGSVDMKGFNETISGLTIINNQGTGSVVVQTGSAANGGTLTLLGDVNISGTSAANVNHGTLGIQGNRIGGTTGTVTSANVGTLNLGGGIRTFNVSATGNAHIGSRITNGGIIKTGGTILVLENASNNYTGLTTVNGGTLRIGAAGALPAGNDFRVISGTLDFNSTSFTTVASGITIGGGAAASTSTIATGTGTLTVAGDVTYDATNNPGTATISGRLDLGGAARQFIVADSTAAINDLTVSALISNGSLTKTGNGVLALSGTNTFNGLTIQGGLVAYTAEANLGAATNPVQLDGGGVLNNGTGQITVTRPFEITANGGTIANPNATNNGKFLFSTVDTIRGSGQLTKAGANGAGASNAIMQVTVSQPNFTGDILLTGGFMELSNNVFQNAGTITVEPSSGQLAELVAANGIVPNNVLVKGGSISADNGTGTFSGTVTFQNAGAIRLGDFYTNAGPARNVAVTGKLSGGGAITVGGSLIAGLGAFNTGALILSNEANDFTGGITVQKALSLTAQAADGVGSVLNGNAITLAGGKLNLRDDGSGSLGSIAYGNNITVTADAGVGTVAGAPTIDVNRALSISSLNNTIELGTLTIGSETLTVSGGNGYGVSFSGQTTLTGATTFNPTTATLTLAGNLSGPGLTFTKTGAGTLRILGTMDVAGYTLSAGTIELPTEPAAGRNLAIPVNTGFSAGYVATQANLIDHVTFDSAGVVGLGVSSTFDPNFTGFTAGLRLGSSANATLTGTITSADGTVRLGGAGGILTLATTNAVGGTNNLDVNTNGTAAGTVVLSSSNNFSGTLAVGGGMSLRANADAALGTGVSPMTLDNATLITGFAGALSRSITIGAGGATLDTSGNAVSISTALGGAGNFTKTGNGTLTLTNTAATYAGKTSILGGTLSVAADSNLGAVPGTTQANQLTLDGGTLQATATMAIPAARGITVGVGGATFEVTGTSVLTLNPVLTGANPITKSGTGTLSVNGNSSTGIVTVNSGTLEITSAGRLNSNITANSGTTLRTLGGTDALGDAANITINSNATFDLRNSDTIGRLIGAGTVTRGSAGTSTLTINSATNAQFDGVIQNGSGTLAITKSGSNTFTLTGTNTYSGATAINTGSIVVQGALAALGNTAVTVGDNNGADETLTLGATADIWNSGTLNRFGDTGSIILNSSNANGVIYNGPALGSTGNIETIGTLTFSNGRNFFNLVPAAGNEVQITTGGLTRANQGFGLIRGANFSSTGAGSTRLAVTNISTLSGANGADGTTTKSIVPFALADTTGIGIGTGFLTSGINGLRLLTASEYDSAITGTTALRNVSVAGGEVVSSSPTINSIRVTGGATSIDVGQKVRLQSGSILFTDAGSIDGAGTIDAGSSDAIITVSNATGVNGTVNSRIAALGGLTVTGFGGAHTVTLGGDNDIAGTVAVNGGATLKLGSSKALNDNYPATVAIRIGGAVQINGNDVTVRNLATSGGAGSFSNGAATAATLTTYLTAAQTVAQGISNGGSGALNLIVGGGNNLTMSGNNSHTGFTELRGGNILLSGNGTGTINQSTAIAINGGILRLTNSNTNNATNRVSDTAPITFNGGTLDFDNGATDASFSETVGAATLASGANVLTVDKGQTSGTARSSVLTIASLARNTGATLNLSSQNNNTAIFDLGTGARSRLVFTTVPTLDDGIVGGWATIDSSANTREFVKYVADADAVTAGNQPSATALVTADYTATLASGANPTTNVKIAASPAALTGATEVNSLNIAQTSATTLDLGTNTLRVESGGIILSGAFNSAINNGTLTVGNGAAAGGDLVIHNLPITSSGLTWTNTSDTVTLSGVTNGQPIVFSTAPGGLTAGVVYYAVNATGTNFQVSTVPGGTFVPITSDGATAALQLGFNTTIGATIADNGANAVNLVKAGGGLLTLGAANTYTGNTYLNGGITRISADASLGTAPLIAVGDKLTLSNSVSLEVTSSMTLDANRGIAIGAGSNVISVSSGTASNGRTLTYNGAITSLGTTEGSLQIKSNLAVTNGVDPGKLVGTLSALDVNGSFRFDAGTLTVTKATNTIGRSLQVGADGSASLAYTNVGGSLTVGKGINDVLQVASGTADITGGATNVSSLNLSALSNFTANVDQVRFGVQDTAQKARASVTFAANNDITAGTQITVSSNSSSGNTGENSTLVFGSGISNVTTKTFILSALKGDATATIAPGGTLNLGGFGANTLDLYISRNNGATGSVSIGLLNGTGGTINGNFNQLVVAEKLGGAASNNNGGATGTFTFSNAANKVSANTVLVGHVDGNNGSNNNAVATNGTINFGGGEFSVTTNVTLASRTGTNGSNTSASGSLNLTGGTFTVGGNITTSLNDTAAAATLNIDGGTLDMTDGTITVDTLTAKSGTLKNVVQIFGGDGTTALPLNKTTGGTLIIDGTNTYTGGTSVSAGTLVVNGSITGSVTTVSGTTLGGSGTIGGAVTIASGATLAPGNSPGTLNTGDLTINGGTFAIEIGSALAYDSVNITGTVNLTAPIALTLDFSAYNPVDLVDSFTLIANNLGDAVGLSGGFTFDGSPIVEGVDFFATSGSFTQAFQLNYHGGDGNDVVLSAVPEPASAVTLLLGSGMLLGMRRSRRRDERA